MKKKHKSLILSTGIIVVGAAVTAAIQNNNGENDSTLDAEIVSELAEPGSEEEVTDDEDSLVADDEETLGDETNSDAKGDSGADVDSDNGSDNDNEYEINSDSEDYEITSDADSENADSDYSSGDDYIDETGTYTTKEDVALYIYTYGELPDNFITKSEARDLGWSGGGLDDYAPGMCIGGDRFGNYEGLLPDDQEYYECDIDTLGEDSRGAERIVYSDGGYIYYTADHYGSFELLYSPEDVE